MLGVLCLEHGPSTDRHGARLEPPPILWGPHTCILPTGGRAADAPRLPTGVGAPWPWLGSTLRTGAPGSCHAG